MDRLFVTGTDTGVGKTVASAALLHAFRARGLRAVGMKPVASGCTLTPAGWRNDDALALQAASDPVPPYEDLNPYALPAPLAAVAAGLAREDSVAAIAEAIGCSRQRVYRDMAELRRRFESAGLDDF
jgi:dethiobiotin synthetase